jgi:hypothetical protein
LLTLVGDFICLRALTSPYLEAEGKNGAMHNRMHSRLYSTHYSHEAAAQKKIQVASPDANAVGEM